MRVARRTLKCATSPFSRPFISSTATLLETLGEGGTIATAAATDSATESDSYTDGETATLTTTETENDSSSGDDTQVTQTLTNTVTTSDDSSDSTSEIDSVFLGANGQITGGGDQSGETDGDSSGYNFDATGLETGSDTGFSLYASLTDSGYGSTTDDWTDIETDDYGEGGTQTDGEDIQDDTSSGDDSDSEVADGQETFADLVGGPSDTATYDSTESTSDTAYDDETTTLDEGDAGNITAGLDTIDWGTDYTLDEDSSVTGASIDIVQTNTDTYVFSQSGTETIGYDGEILSGSDGFSWMQAGSDDYDLSQEGDSEGETDFWGDDYDEDHAYTLAVSAYAYASWDDTGGDSLGLDASITDGSDDYAWDKVSDLTMDVSDSGTAADDSSGTASEVGGVAEHVITGGEVSDYTFSDEGDDTIGEDGTGGSDDYSYDLLATNQASATYSGAGDSTVSGYSDDGWTDHDATGTSSLSDSDEGTVSQDEEGDTTGWDSFDVADGTTQSEDASWSDAYGESVSPTYTGGVSYASGYQGSYGLSATGTETSAGAEGGLSVYPSYSFSQGNDYSDTYSNAGSDDGEYSAGYGDTYSGQGSNWDNASLEGVYWSTTAGPNYVESSQYDGAGQASWQDQGDLGTDWAYSDWASEWDNASAEGDISDVDGTYSESWAGGSTDGETGSYGSGFDGLWSEWADWFALGWGGFDGWLWGMYGYYGVDGIPGIGGELGGLLATAEGRISSALDAGSGYGYAADGLLMTDGEGGVYGFQIGGGEAFYDPGDTAGWWGVWDTHPGEVGYRRHPDGASGGTSGGNLLTPGVIVAPASLNAEIDDDGGMIMGDDQDPSGSSPPPPNQGGNNQAAPTNPAGTPRLVTPSRGTTPPEAELGRLLQLRAGLLGALANNELYVAQYDVTVKAYNGTVKGKPGRIIDSKGSNSTIKGARARGNHQFEAEAPGGAQGAEALLRRIAAQHRAPVQDLGNGTLKATLQDGTVVTSRSDGTSGIFTIQRPGLPQDTVRTVPPPLGRQIEYGSSDLSREAKAYAQQNGITGGRNVAVFEYRADDGSLKTIARASERGAGHAERLIAKELIAMGVKPSQVTRIYSELQPCNLPFAYCETLIRGTFPQAEVTWSFEYGVTPASRAAGLEALRVARGLP